MKHFYLLLFLLLMSIIGIMTFAFYRYYGPPSMRHYSTTQHNDDTLRIAYIGDSWAAMHNDYNGRMAAIIEDSLQRPVIVKSYGICGLTSKEIYNHLFEDQKLKAFMEQGYDYCFISAGINDTYKKMSTTYYKKSMDGIFIFMTTNHIHPIILEIPDYDILKAYDRQKKSKKILRQLSMFVNNTPLDCKQLFRESLNELIREKGYEQKINIIRYKEWNANYKEDLNKLYTGDGMHLNDNGYAVLDSCIISLIASSATCQ